MLRILIILLISTACRAQTLPVRMLVKTPSGTLKTISGFAVMAPDTAMNRIHNITPADSIPHFVFPAAFLNARRKPVSGIVINFDYLFKR